MLYAEVEGDDAMIRAVVFDLAGTLLEGDIYIDVETKDEGLSRLLREAGYDVYYQEVWSARQLVMFIDYPRGRADTPQEYYAMVLERLEIPVDQRLADALAKKAAEFERVRLYPDVVPTVSALRARRIKTAILTTIPTWRFAYLLEKNSVKIDFICTAREAKAVKPNPKIYTAVLETLEVNPTEALMVGDLLETDVTPPKKLGMKGVLLCRTQRKECKEADYVITSLTELLKLIE